MKNFSILLAAILALAIPPAASALNRPPVQADTGSIRGAVTDPQGAVIPNADVQAVNGQTGQKLDVKSNDAGEFEFAGLPFGDYTVIVAANGFKSYQIRLSLSKDSSIAAHNAAMQVALGEVRVDVKMELAGSETLSCVVCYYTYFSMKYTDLPFLRRDPARLVALQPGVAEHKGGFSIAGRRIENKTASLDGLDNRDPATGGFAVSLGLDSLAEFNGDYTNADASLSSSYGQSSASQLSATSKSGTNTYHGQGFWNLGRTGMSANNFFTNRGGQPRDQVTYDQAGFALGGNVSLPGVFSGKDRAFFFISYERERDHGATARQVTLPLASFIDRTSAIHGSLFRSLISQGRMPVSTGQSGGLQDVDGDGLADIGDAAVRNRTSVEDGLAFARVDFVLTNDLQMHLRYNRDQFHLVNDFNESIFTPASPLDHSRKGESFGLSFVASINPTNVNEFKAGYRRGRTRLDGAGSDATQVIALNTPISAGGGLPELPEDRSDRALILADNFTHVAGSHSITAGAQVVRRNDLYATSGLARGRIYYADALAMVTDGRFAPGDASRSIVRAEISESPERERYRLTDLYAFASDSWRAGSRFILNYGTGYNIYSGAVYEQKTDRNNFAPFVSFAYALTDSESLILRGGASIVYVPPTLLAYGEIKATPFYPIATG
ncbi:MAG TPA: carboxypeptidase-like regulatory domain-containing protein, partial [Blastocatellia bacterium]|nr:carboxypeptidase-like regulatory domain-containing protein [Blastocatellia bacterium]